MIDVPMNSKIPGNTPAAKLSIVIPCFNEVNTICSIIDAVFATPFPNKEIIVVDDFSTDGTREIIVNDLFNKIDKIILHEKIRARVLH